MRFQVSGADKATGKERVENVEAESIQQAEAIARRKGLMVESTRKPDVAGPSAAGHNASNAPEAPHKGTGDGELSAAPATADKRLAATRALQAIGVLLIAVAILSLFDSLWNSHGLRQIRAHEALVAGVDSDHTQLAEAVEAIADLTAETRQLGLGTLGFCCLILAQQMGHQRFSQSGQADRCPR